VLQILTEPARPASLTSTRLTTWILILLLLLQGWAALAHVHGRHSGMGDGWSIGSSEFATQASVAGDITFALNESADEDGQSEPTESCRCLWCSARLHAVACLLILAAVLLGTVRHVERLVFRVITPVWRTRFVPRIGSRAPPAI